MRKVTKYYADNCFVAFNSEEEAKKYEDERKELEAAAVSRSPQVLLKLLIKDLEEAPMIPEGTIATCSFQSLQLKGMVKVCQAFAEKYKEYLNYY